MSSRRKRRRAGRFGDRGPHSATTGTVTDMITMTMNAGPTGAETGTVPA